MEETAQAVQETPAEQNAQTVQEAPAEQDAQIVQETQAAPATPENRWHITLSPDETELLARIVWLESQGEPVKGQQAVVEVVFNRMRSDVYPDTLYEVLSQKIRYSSVLLKTGTGQNRHRRNMTPSSRCWTEKPEY